MEISVRLLQEVAAIAGSSNVLMSPVWQQPIPSGPQDFPRNQLNLPESQSIFTVWEQQHDADVERMDPNP